MKRLRIMLTGGGSGGHVYPLLAVAEALQDLSVKNGIPLALDYIGPNDPWRGALEGSGITLHSAVAGKLRRYGGAALANIVDAPKVVIGFLQALWTLYWIMPDAIFSKGGPGAFPVILAGRFYRIPVMLHESDAVPGLTNILSARFARRIAVSFEAAAQYFNPSKTAVTGTPVRRDLTKAQADPASAKRDLQFDPAVPLLLVLGGSQGSQRINEFIVTNLPALLESVQILHQTGGGNYKETEELSRAALSGISGKALRNRYFATPYLNEQYRLAMAAADCVAGRSGSGTIFEIAAFGKPAILIPLPESANDHQRANAYAFADAGGAMVIEEANLLPGIFLDALRRILSDAALNGKMRAAAAAFYKPNAAYAIAGEILNML